MAAKEKKETDHLLDHSDAVVRHADQPDHEWERLNVQKAAKETDSPFRPGRHLTGAHHEPFEWKDGNLRRFVTVIVLLSSLTFFLLGLFNFFGSQYFEYVAPFELCGCTFYFSVFLLFSNEPGPQFKTIALFCVLGLIVAADVLFAVKLDGLDRTIYIAYAVVDGSYIFTVLIFQWCGCGSWFSDQYWLKKFIPMQIVYFLSLFLNLTPLYFFQGLSNVTSVFALLFWAGYLLQSYHVPTGFVGDWQVRGFYVLFVVFFTCETLTIYFFNLQRQPSNAEPYLPWSSPAELYCEFATTFVFYLLSLFTMVSSTKLDTARQMHENIDLSLVVNPQL